MRILEVTPVPCLHCGAGNVPDSNGRRRFVDLERDTNWDDPAILCEDCIMKLGGMVGMRSMDSVKDSNRELKLKNKQIHDLRAEMDSMKRRARRMGMEFAGVES